MEALVLISTPGREIISEPPTSFPCATKRSSMLANHCVSSYLEEQHTSKSVLCSPYFAFYLSHTLVFFLLLPKGLPSVAETQVLCIARSTRRCEACKKPSEMVSPWGSARKKSKLFIIWSTNQVWGAFSGNWYSRPDKGNTEHSG